MQSPVIRRTKCEVPIGHVALTIGGRNYVFNSPTDRRGQATSRRGVLAKGRCRLFIGNTAWLSDIPAAKPVKQSERPDDYALSSACFDIMRNRRVRLFTRGGYDSGKFKSNSFTGE